MNEKENPSGFKKNTLNRRLARFFYRMSFGTRLSLAFAFLIISSATATIFIGNAVFGQKAEEMARARLELDLKVAEQIMNNRLQRLRYLAPAMANLVMGTTIDPRFCSYQIEDTPFDFVLLADAGSFSLMPIRREACAISAISSEVAARLNQSDLGRLIHQVSKSGEVVSGLLVLPRPLLEVIGYRDITTDGLLMMAGTPLKSGSILVLGAILNHRTELVETTLKLLSFHANVSYKSSIFLGDVRIATTLSPNALGTRADPGVSRVVLKEEGLFAGVAEVRGPRMQSAYKPLRDFGGKIVGMLGIATDEDVYGYIRGRTTTLFSTLIGAGMVFGLIISFWFSRRLVRPVTELAEGMNRVAQGDLGFKVRVESGDELGRLANAFNLMVKAVMERDMRLRQMTDEKLSQVEKQVSVGRLAAGVAHEINNPLTAVLSLSMLMRKHLPEKDPRAEDLDIIIAETTRCRDIVRSLLDFARERPPEKRLLDINGLLRDTLVLISRYEAMSAMQTEVRLAPNPLWVNADAKQLQQVFANLLINAAEATRPPGTITIASDEDSSGGFAVITVKDTGKGIPKEFIQRVFEPFFTTKGAGKGTGLGLSVSLGIVQHHNGTIEIESREGEGTTVRVILPRETPERPDGSE